MPNEFIGKLDEIGIGKESVAGTEVAATDWLDQGELEYMPRVGQDFHPGNFGTIDAVQKGAVTQLLTDIMIKSSPTDKKFGHIMMALFGLTYPCVKVPIPGSITGTFVEGEVVTESTSAAKGVIRRLDAGGSSKALYIDNPSLGTVTVTIASPGVFTLEDHGLVAGDSVYLTTTGALPTNLSVNTNYFVIASGLTDDEFQVSATSGGSAINTAGSQSGVHTLWRGLFTGGETLTGATSGATATGGTIESPLSVRHHIFRRANTNNHPTYTIYNHNPLEDMRAGYCMLESLEIEAVAGKFISYSAKFVGEMFASTGAQTPSYTTENFFFGKNASFKMAAAFNSLDAASAVSISRLKLSFTKNLEVFQAVGGTGLTSLHNTVWDVKGDMDLLYNATTQRGYVTGGTEQAMRLAIANSGVTIGSAANPTIQFDLPLAFFTEFQKPTPAGEVVKQTLGFVGQRDVTRAYPCEALLANARITTY